MFNPNNRNQAVHPSIKALALLGPTAMRVIERNKSITIIAAHEQRLGPKVGHFKEVRYELKQLAATYKELASRSDAEIAGLDAVTRGWSAHLQLDTSLDSEEVGITNTRTPKGILDNADSVMDTLRKRPEVPFAEQALSEIEAKHSSAQAAFHATQDGRSAVQLKQRELQSVAADVQKELVKLRTVVRIALGVRSFDYQSLRLRNTRATEAEDETLPVAADSSPESARGSAPSSSG
jgi:hypothetical protein